MLVCILYAICYGKKWLVYVCVCVAATYIHTRNLNLIQNRCDLVFSLCFGESSVCVGAPTSQPEERKREREKGKRTSVAFIIKSSPSNNSSSSSSISTILWHIICPSPIFLVCCVCIQIYRQGFGIRLHDDDRLTYLAFIFWPSLAQPSIVLIINIFIVMGCEGYKHTQDKFTRRSLSLSLMFYQIIPLSLSLFLSPVNN